VLLDRRSLGAKSSAVKRVAEMVTQEYVARFTMQAAEAKNTLAISGGLRDKSKVDRNTVIAVLRAEKVGFMEVGLEADRTLIDSGGGRQAGYPNSVLVHVTSK
jgi:ribosomal protein S17E